MNPLWSSRSNLGLAPGELNVAHTEVDTQVHGPGRRFAVWLQGCAIHCPGCWNKSMWPFSRQRIMTVEELVDKATQVTGLDGITVLGGEPVHQWEALLNLVKRVKAKGLTTVLYTGFELEELEGTPVMNLLLEADITICGRYQQGQRSLSLQWRGSANQKILAPKDGRMVEVPPQDGATEVEVRMSEEGVISVMGFPDQDFLNEVLQ